MQPTVQKTTFAISSRFKKSKTYTKEASYDLVGESDADWSGDVKNRKSTTGYYFKLSGRGAALREEFKCEHKNELCFFLNIQKLPTVAKCTEWGHNYTFQEENSCMILQKGTQVNLTHENFFF